MRSASVVVGGVVLLTGATVLFTFNPSHETFFPKCTLNSVTGMYCPGCGSTRCLHHLSHGRIGTAFRYNPLAVVFVGYLGVAGTIMLLRRAGVPIPRRRTPLHAGWIWGILGAIVIFGVLRNIPAEPFTWLAPQK